VKWEAFSPDNYDKEEAVAAAIYSSPKPRRRRQSGLGTT
jgi:hypothetical protein